MKIRTDAALDLNREKQTDAIAKFWDNLSQAWQQIWGAHIHHGYYEDNATYSPQVAQELLLEKLASYLLLKPEQKLLDVGCGLGGSSIFLAKKYELDVTGITLSKTQVKLAQRAALQAGVGHLSFQVQDALTMKAFSDHQFDVVWSLESCEQFFDKTMFINQVQRILKPKGQFMLATWCASDDEYEHQAALKYYNLCKAFDLPYMPSMSFYKRLLEKKGFHIVQSFDWTKQVEKSWEHGMAHLKQFSLFQLLKMGGIRGYRFVKQLNLMRQALKEQQIKYGVFIAENKLKDGCRAE